jgi:hypothetical protein
MLLAGVWFVVFRTLRIGDCHALAQSAQPIEREDFLYRGAGAVSFACNNHRLAGSASPRLTG